MLSNPGIDVDQILALWVPFVIGARSSLLVAMDWTDFDADNQATIMLSLITEHGRATPLVWLTVTRPNSRTGAASTNAACWSAWPRSCRPGLAFASSPIRHTLPWQYQGYGCQRCHPAPPQPGLVRADGRVCCARPW